MRLAVLAAVLAAPAFAGDAIVDHVVSAVALPRFDGFAAAARALSDAAAADCRASDPALRAAWNAAFDAWLPAQTFRIGPAEADGAGQAVSYWPDPKGFAEKSLRRLIDTDDTALAGPSGYAQVSVAARGLHAIETMIYDPDFNGYRIGEPGCALVRAAAADLAATARRLADDWRGSFAPLLQSAGEPGNDRFFSSREARQALFTQLLTQLEFDKDERVGRPLGTLDKPRPARAESRVSGRSLRNIRLSIAANAELARALGADRTETVMGSFDYAERVARRIDDPVFAGVATPGGRFRVQELADAIGRAADTSSAELAAALGVAPGFNALDGD